MLKKLSYYSPRKKYSIYYIILYFYLMYCIAWNCGEMYIFVIYMK